MMSEDSIRRDLESLENTLREKTLASLRVRVTVDDGERNKATC
jgi:hypothetical protein